MKAFLGVDWGGTYIKAGVVDHSGRIIKKSFLKSADFSRKEVFINKLSELVKDNASFGLQAVGIGAPGLIDVEKGRICYLPNVPGWKNYPLKEVLNKKLNIPVFLDNDANVFGLAEARLGAAKGVQSAIFITLGTGLGGAVILNGKILEGRVSATELGHVPISLNGEPCSCGGTGCIETFVGTRHLLNRYRKYNKGKSPVREVKEIFQRAKAGDKAALKVWEDFSYSLGMFLAGMVNLFNPQTIVIGGGVAGAFDLFKPLLWRTIKAQSMWPQVKGLKIVKAKLDDPGIIGAALLAQDNLQ